MSGREADPVIFMTTMDERSVLELLDVFDLHDVRLLCERFPIPMPAEHERRVAGTSRRPSESLTLRAATADDAPAVATLYIASRETLVACAPLAHSHDEIRRWVREVLLPGGRVRVAIDDGAIVGMVATSDEDGVAWIDQLYVAPDRVGRGIGPVLLGDALGRVGRPVRLWTFQENAPARRFYARHGFEEIELTDGRDNEERCPDVLCERR